MTICITPNCGKEAGLHCPTCIKLSIQGSYYCDQDCFKSNWKEHKKIHEIAGEIRLGCPEITPATASALIVHPGGLGKNSSSSTFFSAGETKKGGYNPYPYYTYTGKLRPFPLSEKRTVPAHIPRPDYADHPKGKALSEEAERGKTTIKILDDEEVW